MKQPPYSPAVHRLVRKSIDPVRYGALALALHTLERVNVPGHIAEVGVYRGVTSSFLHKAALGRTLYLSIPSRAFPVEI